MSDDLHITLKERAGTHGLFSDNGLICQNLRVTMRAGPNWQNLNPAQQLALDEIALKIARILSEGANPNLDEHWIDGAGYFEMGRRACDTIFGGK